MENNAQPAEVAIQAMQGAVNPVLTQLAYPQPQQLMVRASYIIYFNIKFCCIINKISYHICR